MNKAVVRTAVFHFKALLRQQGSHLLPGKDQGIPGQHQSGAGLQDFSPSGQAGLQQFLGIAGEGGLLFLGDVPMLHAIGQISYQGMEAVFAEECIRMAGVACHQLQFSGIFRCPGFF